LEIECFAMAFRLLPGCAFFRDKSEQNCSALAHPFVRPAPGFSGAQPQCCAADCGLNAPLTAEQLKTLIQLQEPIR
jgi:hypothetical protein